MKPTKKMEITNSKNQIQKREIKFRARRLDNSQWAYGDLIQTRHDCYIIKIPFIPALHINATEFIEVDPLTVGQFTGLKDSKGIDIYEGDIIQLNEELRDGSSVSWIGQIDFHSGCFWFEADGRSENCWFHHNEKDIEVIGKIYAMKILNY